MKLLNILFSVASIAASASSVERWGQYEAVLSGPSSGNPFVDVDLNATFTLSKPPAGTTTTPTLIPATRPAAEAPQALVDLDFSSPFNSTTGIRNVGSTSARYPSAQALSVTPSGDLPAGTPRGRSADYGADVTDRHVVEMPADKSPTRPGLTMKCHSSRGVVMTR